MDKRLKQIQQGTLTESRLNSDFLFWLKEQGPNYLLGALLILCAVLGYNWWQQRTQMSHDAAWNEYAEATTPQMLVEVADKHGQTDSIAVLANLDAADRYMESMRSGKRFDREANAPDAAVTPEIRAQYLAEADRLYTKAAAGLDGKPAPENILIASAYFGRAAVAESKGDMASAATYLKAAQAATKDLYPPLATTADERLATLASLSNRPPLPARPHVTLPALGMPGDPTTAPTGDVTASELNVLTGGASAPSPTATPAIGGETPQPK